MTIEGHQIEDPAERSRRSGLAFEVVAADAVDGLGWERPDPEAEPAVAAFEQAYSAARGPALGQHSSVEGIWWDPGSLEIIHAECVGTFEESSKPGLRRTCSAMKVAGRFSVVWMATQLVGVRAPRPVLFTSHLPVRGSTSAQTLAVVAQAAGLRVGLLDQDGECQWVEPWELITAAIPAPTALPYVDRQRSPATKSMTPSLFDSVP